MSCDHGHGHGPWCHWGHAYAPPDYEPPTYRRRGRGRWVPDEEDLEGRLAELEAELVAVRRDLEAARRSGAAEG